MSICYANAIEKTPPGSFLKYRATTVEQLKSQISDDLSVRARYARHFKISPEFVKNKTSNLSLVTLKKPVRVTSYYVGKNGTIHSKKKLLPSGTMVFADNIGKPVLAWSCGNPLSAPSLRRVTKKPIADLSNSQPSQDLTKVAAPDSVSIKAVDTEEIVSIPSVASSVHSDMVSVPQDSLAMSPTFGAVLVPSITAPVSGIEGLVSGLGLLGGLVPASGAVTSLSENDNKNINLSAQPVPEPSSIAVLAMAVGLFGTGGALKRLCKARE